MKQELNPNIIPILVKNNAIPDACQIISQRAGYKAIQHQTPSSSHLVADPFPAAYKQAAWQTSLNVKDNILFKKYLVNRPVYSSVGEIATSKPAKGKADVRETNFGEQNFSTSLLIVSLVFLAFLKIAFTRYLNQFFRSVYIFSEANKLFRDRNALVERVYLLLNIIFVFSGGMFCYYAMQVLFPTVLIGKVMLMLYCFAFILILYLTRYLAINTMAIIMDQKNTFEEYLHSSFIYYKSAGLALLPIVAVLTYVDHNHRTGFVYMGFILVFFMYAISILRGTRIMLQKGILLFYWILYLCTIEFLPIMLFYKVIKGVL